jgi:hypothetical protein
LRIAIIDIDSVCFAAFHPNKQLDDSGKPIRSEDNKRFLYYDKTPKEIEQSCDFLMNQILSDTNSTHYIGFVKGSNTVKLRRSINPEYKADRGVESPKYWEFTKKYFINKWGITESNDIESDDSCRIANLLLEDSYICAIDSDLLSLSGTHYNWMKNKWITNTVEEQNYKFWCDMITGTHNNTKGIPGLGIVGAKRLLNQSTSFRNTNIAHIVFEGYIEYFGLDIGISEYYKNYMCIKTLENYEGFELPELKSFSKTVEW